MASQALGWALFSSALASLVWVVVQAAQGIAYCVMCWAVMTSSVMLAAQLVQALVISTAACHCLPSASTSVDVYISAHA